MQNVPGHREMFQGSSGLRSKPQAKNVFGPPVGLWWYHSLYKNLVKNTKTQLLLGTVFCAVALEILAAVFIFWRGLRPRHFPPAL
jgi:hypothetical protein